MFTGIIKDIGQIYKITKDSTGDTQMEFSTSLDLSDVVIGSSISCNGICLTVTSKNISTANSFTADLSLETMNVTSAKFWQKDDYINLEKSLKLGDEIAGHMVTGHIDGLIELHNLTKIDASFQMQFLITPKLQKFITKKGSIAINGISLTINDVVDNIFYVNIISHSWKNTNLQYLKVGDKVNVEVDLIARYVSKMIGVK